MSSPLAGDRVRALRHLFGLTQVQLAGITGTFQTKIPPIEHSQVPIPAGFLEKAAEATGVPMSFFDAVSPDIAPGSLRHRKRSNAGMKDRVYALYMETYRVVEDLYECTGYRVPTVPVASGEITHDDIERLALEARAALNVAPTVAIRNLTRTLERGGIAVAPLAIPDAEKPDANDDPKGHQGLTAFPGADAPWLIGCFAGLPGDRQRFTLAHELGHLVLHARRQHVPDKQAEDEAHRFAGAFLFPEEPARAVLATPLTLRDYARLKAVWGVAIQALVMRTHHLGYITDDRKMSLFKQISARGWRTEEPVRVKVEQPVLIRQLIEAAYGKGLAMTEVSNRTGLPAILLRSVAPPVQAARFELAGVRRLRPADLPEE